MSGKLDALSPLATLKRGYAVPIGPEGRVLRSVEHFGPEGSFWLRVVDGRVECRTVRATREENGSRE